MKDKLAPIKVSLEKLQPCQLYISQSKLRSVIMGTSDIFNEPVPVTELDGDLVITDGHTRAYTLWTYGIKDIWIVWEQGDIDLESYRTCVKWCKDEGIRTIKDLKLRIVSEGEFQKLWLDRCREMQEGQKAKIAQPGQTT